LRTEPSQSPASIENQAESAVTVAITACNTLRPFKDVEKEVSFAVLYFCEGNVVKAAKLLEISHGTLYNKLKRWGK